MRVSGGQKQATAPTCPHMFEIKTSCTIQNLWYFSSSLTTFRSVAPAFIWFHKLNVPFFSLSSSSSSFFFFFLCGQYQYDNTKFFITRKKRIPWRLYFTAQKIAIILVFPSLRYDHIFYSDQRDAER